MHAPPLLHPPACKCAPCMLPPSPTFPSVVILIDPQQAVQVGRHIYSRCVQWGDACALQRAAAKG